jgi:hypothetical protein
MSHASLQACVSGPRGSKCSSPPSWSGHIPGTLRRDLPGNDENRRDLNRTSNRMRGAFVMVREMLAQDPAYRPTCWPLPTTVPWSATQAALSAAAVNGSNRIVLSCPRSADIDALTCLDDPY